MNYVDDNLVRNKAASLHYTTEIYQGNKGWSRNNKYIVSYLHNVEGEDVGCQNHITQCKLLPPHAHKLLRHKYHQGIFAFIN